MFPAARDTYFQTEDIKHEAKQHVVWNCVKMSMIDSTV